MTTLSKEELQDAMHQLDQAVYYHRRWLDDITRAIICRLPYDQRDVAEDAHRHCRFGQWCYDKPSHPLHDHPAFLAMVIEHRRMHQLGAELLLSSARDAPDVPKNYDSFTNALDRLNLEIDSLRRELEDMFYNRDALTGARNRLCMLTKLRELQQLVKRNVQECGVAIMDLDHFKAVNDTYGHPIGDKVLIASVRLVMQLVRPYDTVFRYGGEEFLLTLPNCDLQTAAAIVERIRNGFAEAFASDDRTKGILTTASFGVTLLDPLVSVEESIYRADTALLAAKRSGRNRTCTWEPSMARESNAHTTTPPNQPIDPAVLRR